MFCHYYYEFLAILCQTSIALPSFNTDTRFVLFVERATGESCQRPLLAFVLNDDILSTFCDENDVV